MSYNIKSSVVYIVYSSMYITILLEEDLRLERKKSILLKTSILLCLINYTEFIL